MFAGDLVVTQHVPVLDGSILGWLAVMDDLALMPGQTLLPGHGPVIDNWRDALAQQRRYLELLTRDVRGLISRGAPISAAARSAGQAEKDRWDFLRNIMHAMPRRHSPSSNGSDAARCGGTQSHEEDCNELSILAPHARRRHRNRHGRLYRLGRGWRSRRSPKDPWPELASEIFQGRPLADGSERPRHRNAGSRRGRRHRPADGPHHAGAQPKLAASSPSPS